MTTWAVEPSLRDPVLVCAFEGWNDAANAATDALRFLIRQLNATDIGGVDAESYFDFQAARPQVEIANGVIKKIRWPNTRFAIARVARAERDLVLVMGVEPNLKWPAFCSEILEMAAGLGCSMAVTLGALLGDAPHSRPVRVTGTADAELSARLGLQKSSYRGPTGIVGILTDCSRRVGMPTVSLWAPVPHYVATAPSPMATHALLDRLAQLTGIPLPLQSLEIAGRGWQQQVTEAINDDNILNYVRELEDSYDHGDPDDIDVIDEDNSEEIDFDESLGWGAYTGEYEDEDDDYEDDDHEEDDLPSGDAIARELEKYLRENGDDEPPLAND